MVGYEKDAEIREVLITLLKTSNTIALQTRPLQDGQTGVLMFIESNNGGGTSWINYTNGESDFTECIPPDVQNFLLALSAQELARAHTQMKVLERFEYTEFFASKTGVQEIVLGNPDTCTEHYYELEPALVQI